jgi:hypothetical protein
MVWRGDTKMSKFSEKIHMIWNIDCFENFLLINHLLEFTGENVLLDPFRYA